jgi:hypothetical protein
MEEIYISFETSKLAKEKGFEELCFYHYTKQGKLIEPHLENGSSTDVEFNVELNELLENHNYKHWDKYSAPTQSLLQKWLREKHGAYVEVSINTEYKYNIIIFFKGEFIYIRDNKNNEVSQYNKYEEALEEGLYEALKLIN